MLLCLAMLLCRTLHVSSSSKLSLCYVVLCCCVMLLSYVVVLCCCVMCYVLCVMCYVVVLCYVLYCDDDVMLGLG